MKRVLAIVGALVIALTAVTAVAAGGKDGEYLIRAVFDNGSFVVDDEDVRVAGANVGSVESVDVTLPGEAAAQGGRPAPGKAVVVLRIDDPAFQDFRADANCQIRPQSLIGERYIDCRPTLPRAPGSEPPPPLPQIPDGEPGEGQRLLPLEQNGKTVDLDLVNNIMRRPYAERFRIILNDLGAGFAARGEDLADIVRRSSPVLRDVDRFVKILADQNHRLARLAAESDRILRTLARERTHVAGFIDNAGVTAEATAERGEDLEADLRKFPRFLRELRLTMREIGAFSDQALPVAEDLDRATPALTTATRRFTPFADASIRALQNLGDNAVRAAPKIAAIRPLVRRTKRLARTGARPLTKSARFLGSVRDSGGFEQLMNLIYNTAASVNGFDASGHYLRSLVVPTNCLAYHAGRAPNSECLSNFPAGPGGFGAASVASAGPRAGRAGGDRRPEATQASAQLLDFLLGR